MNFIQSVEFYVIGSIALFCFGCGVLGGAFFSWLDGKMYLRKYNKRRETRRMSKKATQDPEGLTEEQIEELKKDLANGSN